MDNFTDTNELLCTKFYNPLSDATEFLGVDFYLEPDTISYASLAGTLAGQIFFWWLGDKLRRSKVYRITLPLLVFSSLASVLFIGHTAKGVLCTLCFFRFWLSFVIGGDSHLAVTKRTREGFIPSGTQGLLLAGVVFSMIVSCASDYAYDEHPTYEVLVWRSILISGALLVALIHFLRMKMPDTDQNAVQDMFRELKGKEIENKFVPRYRALVLWTLIVVMVVMMIEAVCCEQCGSGFSLWSIRPPKPPAKAITASAVLGYWFTVAYIDPMGRSRRFFIQLNGFFYATVFTIALAVPIKVAISFTIITFLVPIFFKLWNYFLQFSGPRAMVFPRPGERAGPQSLAHLNSLMISRLRIIRSQTRGTQKGLKSKNPFFCLLGWSASACFPPSWFWDSK